MTKNKTNEVTRKTSESCDIVLVMSHSISMKLTCSFEPGGRYWKYTESLYTSLVYFELPIFFLVIVNLLNRKICGNEQMTVLSLLVRN